MSTHLATRKLLVAIAEGEDCSIAQIVVRTAVSGFLVESACERVEERGLITGSGPMARRRYRLTEAGRYFLARAQNGVSQRASTSDAMRAIDFVRYTHKNTVSLRAASWGAIRRLREFGVQELLERVEAESKASSAKLAEHYLYALVRAGIVVKAGRAGRRPGAGNGAGPAIYRLPDAADPGPLPILWKKNPDVFCDPNSGRIFGLAETAKPRRRAPRSRAVEPVAPTTTHHPGA